MKASLIPGALLLLAGGLNSSAADLVELNGITCLCGEKMAFFVLHQPARTDPLNFALAEGESQFGFKLLAVDAIGHRVQIEKCGAKKFLRLGAAPDLTVTANPEPATTIGQPALDKSVPADGKSVASYLASEELQNIKSGHPIWTAAVAGADKKNTGGQNASAGNNAVAASNPGIPSSQPDYTGELWYQESLSIEQSRALTANDVLAGRLTPFPRTPLTPPETPGQLVGQEVYFANYIPGYQVTGFLNQ
jgi:hypothetical protein